MSDEPKPAAQADKSAGPSAAPDVKPGRTNPAFRALGLPNLRFRLPSRNWMIFLSITGSWTAALVYDRQQKKKIQKKWCDAVAHLAQDTVPVSGLARRVTVFLAAPPGDGIRSAREHFAEYVKPVLVAAAMDWDVVEGRRQGQVRAGLANKIRHQRRYEGESSAEPLEDNAFALDNLRQRNGVQDGPGPKGDIIIGRHTWKEYVRGLHEGWLGPLEAPVIEEPASLAASVEPIEPAEKQDSSDAKTADVPALADPELQTSPEGQPLQDAQKDEEALSTDSTEKPQGEKEEDKKEKATPPKPAVTPPYNTIQSYETAHLPPTIPQEFQPSNVIPFPHILGFLNTPKRMYRFLNRRYLADEVGRQTAATVLAAHRSYNPPSEHFSGGDDSQETASEQDSLLRHEEAEWHKKSITPAADDTATEHPWIDAMTLDARIAERMRRFELTTADERW